MRDYHFDFSSAPFAWANNDIYLSHMFNAPSIVLPYVESFVNYAVHISMHKIQDESLRESYDHFIHQESNHAREHIKYNQSLMENGFSCDVLVNAVRNKLQRIKKRWSLLSVLAAAAAFEHLAMSISKVVLEGAVLNNAENNMRCFWSWHMMEEVEHKNVLMDLYLQMGGGYFRRVTIYTYILFHSVFYGARVYLSLVDKSHVSRLKGMRYLFGRKSFLLKSIFFSLRYYQYNYHPGSENLADLLDFNLLQK